MLTETTMEDILRGNKVVKEVSQKRKLPCLFCSCPPELYEECRTMQEELAGEVTPVRMYVRPEYLMD